MKIFVAAVALVSTVLALPAPPGSAQEVLTNQSIVEMVRAGLSERIIVAKIQSSQTNFDTRTEALIALKQSGVPEKVLEAIVGQSAPGGATLPASPPTGGVAMVPPAGGPVPGRETVFHIAGSREVELMAVGTEIQTNRMPYARTSELVLPGRKAKYRTAEPQPVFVIMVPPSEMPLVRFDPGKDDRNLKIASGSRMPYAGSSQRRGIRGEDVIDVDAERDARGFYRVRPRAPLAPGEYGFVLTRGTSAVTGKVYDFGVD